MGGFRQTYNRERGKFSAPACPEVDGHRVRTGVRARVAFAPGSTGICSHRLWRHSAKRRSALRHGRRSRQRENAFPEVPGILGAHGLGLGDVAGFASHVDLYRSVLAA